MKSFLRSGALIALISTLVFFGMKLFPWEKPIDSYKGVAVYPNRGHFSKSHGRYYSFTGYYYGQKWQCVEFVKRFFYQTKNHSMPNVWGHATDFFDPQVPQGEMNSDRGMFQYRNGGEIPPESDDLMVFQDLTHYGHIAIVTEVGFDSISFIQQNVGTQTRSTLPMIFNENRYWVGDEQLQATGWLRVPKNKSH